MENSLLSQDQILVNQGGLPGGGSGTFISLQCGSAALLFFHHHLNSQHFSVQRTEDGL